MSARCVTAYGLAKRFAKRSSSGMSTTVSPLTPSIMSRRSMNTASFFTRAPTPSASSACQALGAIWMPAPISPNCAACSRTIERKPLRASASAAARPPMPPPAMTTGWELRGFKAGWKYRMVVMVVDDRGGAMKRRGWFAAIVVSILAGCATAPGPQSGEAPDLVLYNGKIVTVDGNFSIAQAVAIRGDRFAAVGSDEAIRRMAGAKTQQIDLKGRTVIPGLIDGHLHNAG